MMSSRDQTIPSRRSDIEVLSDNSDGDDAESEASAHLRKTHGHTCLNFGVEQNVAILPGLLDFGTIVR
jgi:hypothetical protein